MKLYVDFLGPDQCFHAGEEAFLEPSIPLAVLRSAAFLEASCGTRAREPRRIYHVEGGRYVEEHSAAAAGIGEHDSIVLVSASDGAFPCADEVRLRWCAAGGAARRQARFPLPAYALATTASRWLC